MEQKNINPVVLDNSINLKKLRLSDKSTDWSKEKDLVNVEAYKTNIRFWMQKIGLFLVIQNIENLNNVTTIPSLPPTPNFAPINFQRFYLLGQDNPSENGLYQFRDNKLVRLYELQDLKTDKHLDFNGNALSLKKSTLEQTIFSGQKQDFIKISNELSVYFKLKYKNGAFVLDLQDGASLGSGFAPAIFNIDSVSLSASTLYIYEKENVTITIQGSGLEIVNKYSWKNSRYGIITETSKTDSQIVLQVEVDTKSLSIGNVTDQLLIQSNAQKIEQDIDFELKKAFKLKTTNLPSKINSNQTHDLICEFFDPKNINNYQLTDISNFTVISVSQNNNGFLKAKIKHDTSQDNTKISFNISAGTEKTEVLEREVSWLNATLSGFNLTKTSNHELKITASATNTHAIKNIAVRPHQYGGTLNIGQSYSISGNLVTINVDIKTNTGRIHVDLYCYSRIDGRQTQAIYVGSMDF